MHMYMQVNNYYTAGHRAPYAPPSRSSYSCLLKVHIGRVAEHHLWGSEYVLH